MSEFYGDLQLISANAGITYFLGIGISSYQYWEDLPNAVRDMETVGTLLEKQYGVTIWKLLCNQKATRIEIIETISHAIRSIKEPDSLIIYYAGHGHMDIDVKNADGYLVPFDASVEKESQLIRNSTIRDFFKKASVRHLFLISDACFSGSLLRERSKDTKDRILAELALRPSRLVLCSGRDNEKVSDGPMDGHSPFADALITTLKYHRNTSLSVGDLARDVQKYCKENYENQLTDFGYIHGVGDKRGELVLWLEGNVKIPGWKGGVKDEKIDISRPTEIQKDERYFLYKDYNDYLVCKVGDSNFQRLEEERVYEILKGKSRQVYIILNPFDYLGSKTIELLLCKFPQHTSIQRVVSIFEAIGGYIQDTFSYKNISLQIVEVNGEKAFTFGLSIKNGKYHFDGKKKFRSIDFGELIRKHLFIDLPVFSEFQHFLSSNFSGQKTYLELVKSAMNEFKTGKRELNELITSLDNPRWSDITIEQLVKMESEVCSILSINEKDKTFFLGEFTPLFDDLSKAKKNNKDYLFRGLRYINKHLDDFYPGLSHQLQIHVYCYPKMQKISLVDPGKLFPEYYKTNTIQLVDRGQLTFTWKGSEHKVKTNFSKKLVDYRIRIDGNQALVISTDTRRYLIA